MSRQIMKERARGSATHTHGASEKKQKATREWRTCDERDDDRRERADGRVGAKEREREREDVPSKTENRKKEEKKKIRKERARAARRARKRRGLIAIRPTQEERASVR